MSIMITKQSFDFLPHSILALRIRGNSAELERENKDGRTTTKMVRLSAHSVRYFLS